MLPPMSPKIKLEKETGKKEKERGKRRNEKEKSNGCTLTFYVDIWL